MVHKERLFYKKITVSVPIFPQMNRFDSVIGDETVCMSIGNASFDT